MNGPSFRDVLAVTGSNARQISYWCNDELIPGQPPNPGTGNHRRWTWEQVRYVMALRQLSLADLVGVSFRTAATACRYADWDRPVEVRLARHVAVVINLPGIVATVDEARLRNTP